MTCQEIHEQITAFVDDRIDEDEYRRKVGEHISYCSECRRLYEMELKTKLTVSRHARREDAPAELRESINAAVDSLDAERRRQIEKKRPAVVAEPGWLDRFAVDFVSPAGIAVALVIMIAGAVAVWNPFADSTELADAAESGPPPPPPELAKPDRALNFFNAASRNFDLIQAGELSPSVASSDLAEIQEHFRSNGIDYPLVPVSVKLPLKGGVVSDHNTADATRHFAHLVYGSEDITVYMFEVPQQAVADGDVVYLTEDSMQRLEAGEQLWEEAGEKRSLVIFSKGQNVIAAVGNVNRPTLRNLLSL